MRNVTVQLTAKSTPDIVSYIRIQENQEKERKKYCLTAKHASERTGDSNKFS